MPTQHIITGGGGLRLAVHEYGSPEGKPIVLIHGINPCSLVWHKQYRSSLAEEFRLVCLDLRGHGMSEKPTAPEYYNQATLWADDILAVLTALSLRKPILVGWSYGGYVINDYLAQYGDGAVGGINYVCAGVVMGGEKNHQYARKRFQSIPCLVYVLTISKTTSKLYGRSYESFFKNNPSSEDFEVLVACSMVVPPTARLGMFSRTIDRNTVMKGLKVPVLVTKEDEKDTIVTSAHTAHALDLCSTCRGIGVRGHWT